MLQVSLALERKANEPFATLRLVTHTPAVWILNFRVRDTKSGRAFRHTATCNAHSCSVDRTGVTPVLCLVFSIINTEKDYLARDSLFRLLPGDDLGSQGLAPQVLSALERKADELFATLRPVTHAPAVWDPILTIKQNKEKLPHKR